VGDLERVLASGALAGKRDEGAKDVSKNCTEYLAMDHSEQDSEGGGQE
jgi:hypothetical protein